MHINYLDVKEKLQQGKFKQDLNELLLYTHFTRKIKTKCLIILNIVKNLAERKLLKLLFKMDIDVTIWDRKQCYSRKAE